MAGAALRLVDTRRRSGELNDRKLIVPKSLHIVIVEESAERARIFLEGLADSGDYKTTVISNPVGLARKVVDLKPDVVLIAMDNPSRDMMEQLTAAATPADRPVAMFVDKTDSEMMKDAINAGVSAYIVDGLRPDRIRPIIEAAVARFQNFSQLRKELSATKAALAERKTIDRAKGLLMKARGISEDDAYELLRKTAMDSGKRIVDVADSLVTAAGLLS